MDFQYYFPCTKCKKKKQNIKLISYPKSPKKMHSNTNYAFVTDLLIISHGGLLRQNIFQEGCQPKDAHLSIYQRERSKAAAT